MATALALPPDDPRRSDGPVLLALPPKPPLTRGAATGSDAGEFSARDVINALHYHSVLFLFLGTILAALCGAAAWTMFPAKYTTHAMLRVDSFEQTVADRGQNGTSRTEFGTYLSTQAARIKSHQILNRALGQQVAGGQALAQLPMFQNVEDKVARLDEKLVIEFSDRSEIMKVGMIGDDPQQIAAAVNAVIDSLLTEVRTDRQFKQNKYDKLLSAKNEQVKALEEMQKSYQAQFRQASGNDATVQARKFRLGRYIQLMGEQSRVASELRYLSEQLPKAQTKLQEEQKQTQATPEAVVPELGAMVDSDGAVVKKTAEIKRTEDYVSYCERTHSNKNSDYIKEQKRRLAKEQTELDELKKQIRTRITTAALLDQKRTVAKAGGVETAVELTILQNRFDRLQFDDKDIKEKLLQFADLEKEEAGAGPPPEQKMMQMQLSLLQDRVGSLIAQADVQRIELTADDRIKLYEKASVPQQKEMKKQLAFTGAGALAGYFIVGGLLTVGEVRRKRVYSHRDPVFARLPLLGRIPENGFVAPAAGAEPAADDTVGLAFREAIDRIKTLALRQMTLKKARALLVVSPAPDEGKSILAWNLAAGFARSDYKVLFIDANLLHPTIQRHLNVKQVGLSEVLRGEATLGQAIFATPVANLDCLVAGQPDAEARRCLDKVALQRVLDKARNTYDFVVLDTCSLSEAVDPLCLAQRVDAAIVSLRTFKSRTPAADMACQRLQLLGTPVLGTVLTDPTLTVGEV